MLGFYIAGLVLVALAVLGAWFWNAWTNWQFGEAEARRRQQAAADELGVPVETAVDLGDGVKLELVLIPPGMFDMGSPDDLARFLPQERPLHRVRISRAFYMGKYEVTQGQWEKVMGANPSAFKGPRLPVECVSWDDCQDFLKKLNETSPHPFPLPAAGEGAKRMGGFRLPTEAEWEWACRAGTNTRFCFGDDEAKLGEYAWCAANSGGAARGKTHPVDEKHSNAWGLHDCHGNVWELCADWYGRYAGDPWPGVFRWTRDPQGPAAGPGRVLRGGSWSATAAGCRSAVRVIRDNSGRSYGVIGFRVALSISAP